MFRLHATLLAAAAGAAAQDPGTAPRTLEPIDLFRLDFFMTAGGEEPAGWLDAAHYAVFDAGANADPRARTKAWWRVHARSGAREPLLRRPELVKSLRRHLDAAKLVAIDDIATWTWNGDHTRFVLDIDNDLFCGDLRGEVVRLTSTPESEEVGVRISPDGEMVAFVADHDLHVVPSRGGDVRALTTEGHEDLFFGRLDWVYQEELYGRGNFEGYWWSPDSRRIALLMLDESPVEEFVLVRSTPARPKIERTNYPKAGEPNPVVEVGVIDVGSGAKRWFDLSDYPPDDRLAVRVTWHPQSAEVFFQIQGREQRWLDMLAGDAENGEVRRLWREDSDCWVEAGPEPKFVRGGAEFLWLSERDGRKHVYHYRSDGELIGQRTAGEWQVTEIVGFDERRDEAWVLSDRSGPLETQLWLLPLGDGEMRRVTKIDGTHEVVVAPDHATFLSTRSDVSTPPATTLRGRDDEELRVVAESRPEMMDAFGITTPELLQVETRDGFPMEAMLFRPQGFEAGRQYPAVQFCYAGPHTPRVRNRWGSRDQLWHQLLAQRGYVVFVCDNRSASGKGRKFAKACWREPGQSELRDLEDGVDWLAQRDFVDGGRIAIWGWSYGGYQTLYNLTHSDKWKCGVAVNAVTDWRLYDTIYTERYFGLPSTNAAGYDAGSVVAAAKDLRGALLLMAATMDDNVHVQNTLQFLHALQKAGKDCDLMLYPEVRHSIGTLEQQLHLFGRFLRFLERELR